MRRALCCLAILAAGCAPQAPPAAVPPGPSTSPPPAPPGPDLPATIGDWAVTGEPQNIAGEQIYDYMDGEGEVPVACGYRTLHVRRYAHSGGLEAKVEVYEMGSQSNAFGYYAQRRQPGDTYIELTHRAKVAPEQVVFWHGTNTVVVYAEPAEKGDADLLTELAQGLDSVLPGDGHPPDLLRRLPPAGRVADSEGYFHGQFGLAYYWFDDGNRLRLSDRTNVAGAMYDGDQSVLVVEYPNAGAAEAVAESLGKALTSQPTDGGWIAQDGETWTAATRHEAMLGLVTYAKDAAAAKSRLAALTASLASPAE